MHLFVANSFGMCILPVYLFCVRVIYLFGDLFRCRTALIDQLQHTMASVSSSSSSDEQTHIAPVADPQVLHAYFKERYAEIYVSYSIQRTTDDGKVVHVKYGATIRSGSDTVTLPTLHRVPIVDGPLKDGGNAAGKKHQKHLPKKSQLILSKNADGTIQSPVPEIVKPLPSQQTLSLQALRVQIDAIEQAEFWTANKFWVASLIEKLTHTADARLLRSGIDVLFNTPIAAQDVPKWLRRVITHHGVRRQSKEDIDPIIVFLNFKSHTFRLVLDSLKKDRKPGSCPKLTCFANSKHEGKPAYKWKAYLPVDVLELGAKGIDVISTASLVRFFATRDPKDETKKIAWTKPAI